MLDLSTLVDSKNGLVSTAVYMDEEVYRRELEQIFGRCWLYLAHETQIPNPGDFVSAYMGEDPVIVIRDTAGRIGAFLNRCRHRGATVCRADAGNAASFTCPYHGWTYANDGSLMSVPGFKDNYGEALDMEQWGLTPVAQLAVLRGFVFATLDPLAPPLADYLGDMTWWIEALTDRTEGGIEIVPGVLKWRMKTNWKFAAEQFGGDSYHSQPSHASAVLSGFAGALRQQEGGFVRQEATALYHANMGNGHGTLVSRIDASYRGTAEMADYERQLDEQRAALAGSGTWRDDWWPGLGTVFPNFSRLTAPFNSFRVWHPRGPQEIEIWSWTFVDRTAPPEVKEATRLFSLRAFGPAGGFEQDDGENWSLATHANQGFAARRTDMNFQMGLGEIAYHEDPSAWAAERTSESNARAFFQRWLDLMEGRTWEELAGADRTPRELEHGARARRPDRGER